MANSREHIDAAERIRHAAWAGLVALVLAISTLLLPLDQMTWTIQARIANFTASGDIVYVGSERNLTDPAQPDRRVELADTLDRLRAAGVDRVYVDMVFDRPSSSAADARLHGALAAFDGDAFLVNNISTGLNGELALDMSDAGVAAGIPSVGNLRWQNYLGHTWTMPYSITYGDATLPSMPASIMGIEQMAGEFPINYGFDLASIPTYRLRDLSNTLLEKWW